MPPSAVQRCQGSAELSRLQSVSHRECLRQRSAPCDCAFRATWAPRGSLDEPNDDLKVVGSPRRCFEFDLIESPFARQQQPGFPVLVVSASPKARGCLTCRLTVGVARNPTVAPERSTKQPWGLTRIPDREPDSADTFRLVRLEKHHGEIRTSGDRWRLRRHAAGNAVEDGQHHHHSVQPTHLHRL